MLTDELGLSRSKQNTRTIQNTSFQMSHCPVDDRRKTFSRSEVDQLEVIDCYLELERREPERQEKSKKSFQRHLFSSHENSVNNFSNVRRIREYIFLSLALLADDSFSSMTNKHSIRKITSWVEFHRRLGYIMAVVDDADPEMKKRENDVPQTNR